MDIANNAIATVENFLCKWCSRLFLDCAFDEFCFAGKLGSEWRLGNTNEFARAQFEHTTGGAHAPACEWQRIFPACRAVILLPISIGRGGFEPTVDF